MAIQMQLKVLFGRKPHDRPDIHKEKTTKSCLFRCYLLCSSGKNNISRVSEANEWDIIPATRT